MPSTRFQQHLNAQLDEIRNAGLFKGERVIATPQQPHVRVSQGSRAGVAVPGSGAEGGRGGEGDGVAGEVLNLCANNYLGLANHPDVVAAAREALDRWGYGVASVRFICGTTELHKRLERAVSDFLGTEDTILYSSCWDANGGLFETILGPE